MPREPARGSSQPCQPYRCPGPAAALAGAWCPLPTGQRPSALEQGSGLEVPLCTEAGPPAPRSTTEQLPGIRPRQGMGRKTQGQLSPTVWVQPGWPSAGIKREAASAIAASHEVGSSFLGCRSP